MLDLIALIGLIAGGSLGWLIHGWIGAVVGAAILGSIAYSIRFRL